MLIHLPHAVKSIDLFTDLLQWIISTQGLHTAAPAWIGARGALHMNKKGVRSFWSSQERLRMLLGRTQPLSCIWGVSWLENTFNLQNSSPGMEFLLNRATISSYGHCGLTSTSWGKKKLSSTFPGWAVARHWNKNMQQLHKLCKWSKLYSRVHGLVGKFLRAHNDWAGSSLQQTYLSKKDKKKQKNPLLGIQLLNIRNTASSNHNSLFYSIQCNFKYPFWEFPLSCSKAMGSVYVRIWLYRQHGLWAKQGPY